MKNTIIFCFIYIILFSSCNTNAQLTATQNKSVQKIRIHAKPTTTLNQKWYAPQQSISTTITPMVTPQFIFQSTNGRGYSGPGSFINY